MGSNKSITHLHYNILQKPVYYKIKKYINPIKSKKYIPTRKYINTTKYNLTKFCL